MKMLFYFVICASLVIVNGEHLSENITADNFNQNLTSIDYNDSTTPEIDPAFINALKENIIADDFNQTQSSIDYTDSTTPEIETEETADQPHAKVYEDFIQRHFIGLSHNLSSDNVTILDRNIILIHEFTYDGLSPDAHFMLGTGELSYDNGVIIPDQAGGFKKLSAYHRETVVLSTQDKDVSDYNWLSVWCSLDEELIGYVYLRENATSAQIITKVAENKPDFDVDMILTDISDDDPMRILSEFMNVSHGVKSGPVNILNESALFIPNFYYDGNGNDVNFWVGKGDTLFEDGFIIPYETYETLPIFKDANVILIMPDDFTMNDLEWLYIWDAGSNTSFGQVQIHPEVKLNYIQLLPLTPDPKYSHGINSGPILIIDTRTIFITNIHYDGNAPDAHFWAGSSINGPDENGHLLLNELNSTNPLQNYSGTDIYLTLPEYANIHTLANFGIWSSSLKTSLAYTNITKDLSSVPKANGHYQFNAEGKYIARLPKCCPINKVKTAKGCVNRITSIAPMRIHEGNMSIFDDEPMQNVVYEPYTHKPNCNGMFRMEPSEMFYLLTSGILLLPDGNTMTKENFCYDVSKASDENIGWEAMIFICFEAEHVPAFLNILIATCIYISSFFLIVTSVIFVIFREARKGRGFNVVGYTSFMSYSFGCLATARILHVTGLVCTILGFIYQYFLVSSFTWLLCLSADIFYQVWWFKKGYNKQRYYIFGGFATCFPILAVFFSIFINNTVPTKYAKTSFGYEPCWFRSDKKVMFYYTPIGVSIILNFILISLTWYKIKKSNNISGWKIRVREIKNVFRSCYLLLGIMAVCWTAEIISYNFETNNGFWIAIDVIDSLQGFFVFLVFIMHDPVIDILKRRLCPSRMRKRLPTNSLYDTTLRPPSEHGVLLSKLQNADSVEDLCT